MVKRGGYYRLFQCWSYSDCIFYNVRHIFFSLRNFQNSRVSVFPLLCYNPLKCQNILNDLPSSWLSLIPLNSIYDPQFNLIKAFKLVNTFLFFSLKMFSDFIFYMIKYRLSNLVFKIPSQFSCSSNFQSKYPTIKKKNPKLYPMWTTYSTLNIHFGSILAFMSFPFSRIFFFLFRFLFLLMKSDLLSNALSTCNHLSEAFPNHPNLKWFSLPSSLVMLNFYYFYVIDNMYALVFCIF